ncbi:MAG: hypothetical protein P1P87_08110 [Trueperaceae bacterium]|nr:hypothetical protein [Trueperaceae bacterium]
MHRPTPDPLRGVYLRPLPDSWVPARASAGARGRAAQLQAFLRPLQVAAAARFDLHGHAELWVANPDDWARLTSAPYGWPFTRTRRTPASAAFAAGPTTAIVVAADVPGRLIKRFEPVLLAAARSGVRAPVGEPAVAGPRAGVDAATLAAAPPVRADVASLTEAPWVRADVASLTEAPWVRADVRELVDLVVGHEWGHAVAQAAGLRTHVKWLDELLATVLYLAALRATGADATLARFRAWAEVQRVGGAAAAEAAPPRYGRAARPAAAPRRDLGAFETPRGKLRLPDLVWFQGVFTERAWALVEAEGWGFPERLLAALEGVDTGPGARARGDVARAVVAVEPSFRDWFRTFGVEE